MTKNCIMTGDAIEVLRTLESESVDMCVTSPPYYGLRDYGVNQQIGLEETPEQYIEKLVGVFREVKRVLKGDGTLWVNISDSYAGSGKGRNADGTHSKSGGKQQTNKGAVLGHLKKTANVGTCKPKDLIGIPWMLAFALRADGWYLRQDIIWRKPNAMPESVKDRFTKSYEHIFMLSKERRYYFDHEAAKEPRVSKNRQQVAGSRGAFGQEQSRRRSDGKENSAPTHYRTRRDVWDISTRGGGGVHFATFPESIPRLCIEAGSRKNGVVLDPFIGSGTTAIAAMELGRKYIGIELNAEYAETARKRIAENESRLYPHL